MWFSTLSGLYPRNAPRDPVAAWLRWAALWLWFTWLAAWGWMLFDLLDGVPVLAIFGGQEVPIDAERIEAAIPGWLIQQGAHLVACLAVHVAQTAHAMNLPWHKWRPLLAVVRRADDTLTRAEILARLLDDEARSGGFELETVLAFVTHADLDAWPTRVRVLRTWVRLRLTDLDGRVVAGDATVEHRGRLDRVQDVSMKLQTANAALRRA